MRPERGISNVIVGPVLHALATDLGVALSAPVGPDAAHVPGAAADALIDEAARRAKKPHLALDLAARIPIGGLGVLDYALCTSPTLGDALRRVARYYGVVTERVRLTLTKDEARATLTFERNVAAAHSRHWAEFGVAMIALRIKQTLGRPVKFESVTFAHRGPKDAAPYRAFFGCEVAFGGTHDRMSFRKELLELPLVTAAASLAATLEDTMRSLAPEPETADPFLSRAARTVGELLLHRDVALESLAARLKITRRTLQRELQRRGTSHKALLDDARRARALHLLEDGRLSVTEVAYALGLSEPSAFFRAFRRWTGTSPAAFRAGVARNASRFGAHGPTERDGRLQKSTHAAPRDLPGGVVRSSSGSSRGVR
jgi:AraC-like DNA-binding protein